MDVQALPDKGQKLLKQIQELEEALGALALSSEPGKMAPRTRGSQELYKRHSRSPFDKEYVDSFTFPFDYLLLSFLKLHLCFIKTSFISCGLNSFPSFKEFSVLCS